eukprot:6469124-Amphidinium_carterae.1
MGTQACHSRCAPFGEASPQALAVRFWRCIIASVDEHLAFTSDTVPHLRSLMPVLCATPNVPGSPQAIW